MLVGDNYKIESDSLNVTLYERAKSKKPSTTTWRAIGYFANPQNALKHLVDLGVMETSMKDFDTVVKKQNELYTLINSLKGMPERVESCRGLTK